jgi:RNA polymerase sigma factor (sigma-70 family)
MPINVEELYRQYGPMVLRRCRRLLKSEAECHEAMQDTFVLLLRNQATLSDEAPSSLLYRMATNVCLNKIRAMRSIPSDVEAMVAQIATSEDLEERFISRSILQSVFRSEPVSSRLIATLFYVDGMTHEEVSRATQLSVSGVRKRLSKIKRIASEENH